MAESEPTAPKPSLYGDEPKAPEGPQPPPQSVLDQLWGLFTDPVSVFQRLYVTPRWLPALLLFMGVSLVASMLWAAKVDSVALTERRFEVMEQAFGIQVPAEALDKALEAAREAKPPYVGAVSGTLLGMPLGYVIMAAILFALVRLGSEDESVTFRHAMAVSTVHALVALPIPLLGGLMAALTDVGGASSYASLAPTTLAYWIRPEHLWLRGVLSVVDPFYLFSFVTLYLGARYTLRLSGKARWGLMILMGAFGGAMHVLGGVFA